jgi:hypothetical protein
MRVHLITVGEGDRETVWPFSKERCFPGVKENRYGSIEFSLTDDEAREADGSCPAWAEIDKLNKAAESQGSGVKRPMIKNVPFCSGVGLRVTAKFIVNEGSVDLGNLIASGAAAQAKQVSGTMNVQALGITGRAISALMPMPSEINASTIQNALLNLGAIKAKIYDEGTNVTPRDVGLYNTVGSPGIISQMIYCVLKNGASPYPPSNKCP